MRSFEGKVVIITGSGSGIGLSTALAFAKEGASVTIADVNETSGIETLSKIKELGGRGISIKADVSISADCHLVVTETINAFNRIDILFNNCGIQPPNAFLNVEDLPEELWDQMLAVNLKSYYLMSKYAIPEIRKMGGGAIVNTASVQGLQSERLLPAYAASKGAVLSLTRQMALDYAKENIRVLAVCPGSIDTPMNRAIATQEPGNVDDTMRAWGRKHPLGRMGTGEDIAHAVLFLASEKASFMTGEYINVDGGLMAQGAWTTTH